MKAVITAVMALAVAVCPRTGYSEQDRLRINCTVHSVYEAFFLRLVHEVCARNNIVMEHNTPPVGRSLQLVHEGIDDGDGPRIANLSSIYPNLIHVAEPFGEFHFGAFAKSEDLHIDGWDGLHQLNVAYLHGWKIFERHVHSTQTVTRVKNSELLFKLLDSGRTDVVLITKLAGYDMIRTLGLKGIHFVEPPLAVEPNYLYLHKRHRDWAPKLAKTLSELKQDGTYDRLYAEIILPLLP